MSNAVIIDDEKHARKILRTLLADFSDEIAIVGEADSVKAGIDLIKSEKPDLVFLDIEMPNGNGFKLLDSFKNIDFEVIFTTAYSEYAINAIKFSALDYLLKPIGLEELKSALNRYKEKVVKKQNDSHDGVYFLPNNLDVNSLQSCKIVLPIPKGFKVIPVSKVVFCEASGSYTIFHFLDKTSVIVGKNLKYFEEKLYGLNFMRVHDSYMINLDHIDTYIRGRGGVVVMSEGSRIDISRNKKDVLLNYLSNK